MRPTSERKAKIGSRKLFGQELRSRPTQTHTKQHTRKHSHARAAVPLHLMTV